MKLHRLEIKNIASLEHAVVDFDADPIAGADVFLITGPTGAGKSTILDAISIALYGRVPRFGSVRRNGDDFDNVSFNDVRQILRQGTGKGEIRLTFDGNDGCSYESHWTVRRAHDKPDRNFQNVEWTLVCNGDTAAALTKAKDIQPAVVKALGFDYEQYVRTSMLAQGEFTRFLKAGDSEKSEILTKLTRTEIYARIGRRIFEITKNKKEEFERQQALIDAEHLLSDEERARLGEEARCAADDAAAMQKIQEGLAVRLRWLGQWRMLESRAETARSNLASAAEAYAAEDVKALRRTVADWRDTAQARAAMADMAKADIEIADAARAIELLKKSYAQVAGAFDSLKTSAEKKAAEVCVAESLCHSIEWRNSAFARYEEIISVLDVITKARERYAKETGDKADCESKMKADAKNVEVRKAVLEREKRRESDARTLLAEAEKKALRYDINALAARQKELQDRINRCCNLKISMERLVADLAALRQKRERYEGDMKAMAVSEASLPAMRAVLEEAKNRSRNSDDLFKVLDFSHQRWASVARAGLTPGCTCPVCLQTVDTLPPMEETIARQWSMAAQKAEEDRAAMENAAKALSDAEADLNSRRKECGRILIEIEKDEEALKESEKLISASAATLGIECDGALSAEAVDSAIEEADRCLADVTVRIADYSAAAGALKAAQKVLADCMTLVQKAQNELHQADMVLKVTEERIERCRTAAEHAGREAAAAIESLRSESALTEWESRAGRMFVSAADFKEYFTATKHESDSALRRLETLRNENLRLTESIRALQSDFDSIHARRPDFMGIEHTPAEIRNISDVLARLASAVVAECTALNAATAKKTRYTADYELFMKNNPRFEPDEIRRLSLMPDEVVAGYEKRLRDIDDALLKARTAEEEIRRQRTALMDTKPEIPDGETFESMESDSAALNVKIADLHAKRGGIIARLAQNDEALLRVAALKAKFDQAREEWEKWSVLNEHFGSSTGDKFNRIAQSFVLRSLLERANEHLSRLSKRYRLRGVDGQYIILLEDAENNYRCRPVVTGSGGETFLVSLSLALALAGEGRNVAADILFIDEGFGTLSGEPLQRAVSLLRSLHSNSRKQVGIISHVEELKSEIPVQIQVVPDQAGGVSRVDVRKLGEA